MFKEQLQTIVEQTDGGLAGLIMDASGIALEVYVKDGVPFDITTLGIEFGVVLGSIKRAAEMLEVGETKEVSIGSDDLVTIMRTLGDQYFLALTMKADGNLGKGRYLMRTAAPQIQKEL